MNKTMIGNYPVRIQNHRARRSGDKARCCEIAGHAGRATTPFNVRSSSVLPQLLADSPKLFQRRFEIVSNFGRKHVRVREVG